MDAKDVERTLDQALPDAQVIRDIQAILQAEAKDGIVQIELDEQCVPVPVDAEIVLVTKAFFKEYPSDPFGVYRVQVAIGDITSRSQGILKAKHCFATLYYNAAGVSFTVDFHRIAR